MIECDFKFAVPVTWEKRFVAAVEEQVWLAAIAVLHSSGPLSLTRAAASPRVANALAQFLMGAPLEAVAGLRRHLEPEVFPQDSHEVFRFSALLRITQAHLELASWFGNRHELGGAYAHTRLAMSGLLVPRTQKTEMILAAGLLRFAKFVGRAEQGFAEQRPDLENDPGLPSPSNELFAKSAGIATGYDSRALPDLIQHCLLEVAASDSLMLSALQSAFEHAHWPSWRGLLALHRLPRLQSLSATLLSENVTMSLCAKNHLRLLSGPTAAA